MRALDGFSERVMRESGDKTAGQQLAKEALKIELQQLESGKEQPKNQVQDQFKITEQQERKVRDLRPVVNDRVRPEGGNASGSKVEWKKSNDGQVVDSEKQCKTEPNIGKSTDVRRTAERDDARLNEVRKTTAERNDARLNEARRTVERNEARRTELNEARRTAERNDARLAEARRTVERNEARRTAERNEARRTTELNESRRTAERNEARKAEMETRRLAEAKEVRRAAEAKEARRVAETKNSKGDAQDAPSMLDGRKWQKDGSGNFVSKDKNGRLITQDAKGKIVDYQSHVNQKHMANQDQMAFMSILFCNPLMMMGMGAGLAIMDQNHAAKTAKLAEGLGPKFDGKNANKTANQTGYAGEMSRKAMLMAQHTRQLESQELAQMNGLAGTKGAAAIEREAQRKKELKQKQTLADRAKQPITKASMPTDRYSMSTKKLLKTKRLIEEEIERVRGKASLEEVSRLYSQVEVLEKALKRLENF